MQTKEYDRKREMMAWQYEKVSGQIVEGETANVGGWVVFLGGGGAVKGCMLREKGMMRRCKREKRSKRETRSKKMETHSQSELVIRHHWKSRVWFL